MRTSGTKSVPLFNNSYKLITAIQVGLKCMLLCVLIVWQVNQAEQRLLPTLLNSFHLQLLLSNIYQSSLFSRPVVGILECVICHSINPASHGIPISGSINWAGCSSYPTSCYINAVSHSITAAFCSYKINSVSYCINAFSHCSNASLATDCILYLYRFTFYTCSIGITTPSRADYQPCPQFPFHPKDPESAETQCKNALVSITVEKQFKALSNKLLLHRSSMCSAPDDFLELVANGMAHLHKYNRSNVISYVPISGYHMHEIWSIRHSFASQKDADGLGRIHGEFFLLPEMSRR